MKVTVQKGRYLPAHYPRKIRALPAQNPRTGHGTPFGVVAAAALFPTMISWLDSGEIRQTNDREARQSG
jgi:hypothetical protein